MHTENPISLHKYLMRREKEWNVAYDIYENEVEFDPWFFAF